MKKNSLWQQYQKQDILPKLDKDIKVDVLIIGGGMTGLSTAYHLIESGLKVALVERNAIGYGITSKTTGKLTYLQGTVYNTLNTYHNKNISKQYLDSQKEAIKIIKDIINKNHIECHLEKSDSYLFTNKTSMIPKINKEASLLKEFHVKVSSTTALPDNTPCKLAIKVSDTHVFNPIEYLNSLKDICLKNKIDIYEKTKINDIKYHNNFYYCHTSNNVIQASFVVLTLHYPYFLFPFLMPMKTKLEKSYIEAFKTSENLHFNAINIEKPTKSIRYYTDSKGTYKIFLTGSHNIAIKNNESANFDELEKINHKKMTYHWSNIDIITNDYLPFVGRIKDNLLIGTGYNTWGMTNSTIAGKILSDIIQNKENHYESLFDPKRKLNIGKIINFPLILSTNIYSFLNTKINLNKSWYSKNLHFETINNQKIAIYTDKNKKEHLVYPICPHLKCSLIFNEEELTWDCPCHGSRFDIDGYCLEGPSNYNITYKKK